MHHKIVSLESIHMAIPHFDIPPEHTAEQIVHHTTQDDEVVPRIQDATIVVTTTRKVTAALVEPAVTPKLRLIAQLGTGVDNIDMEACRARGIMVVNTPNGNIESVSEHAIALYFGARRSLAIMHNKTVRGDWKAEYSIAKMMRDSAGEPPKTCTEETCGIVGYGAIGKRIAKLASGMGMKVIISGRKGADTGKVVTNGEIKGVTDLDNPERTPFSTLIQKATVIFLVCPLNEETRNLISTPELAQMQQSCVLINVARGGVVNQEALATALKERKIAGAASDVFSPEPSGLENPLLSLPLEANFVASPHVAWFAQKTMDNLSKILKNNIESYLKGTPENIVS